MKGVHLHICTFSHLHISQAFAHSHICTFTTRYAPKAFLISSTLSNFSQVKSSTSTCLSG